jgi:hypothetical protein
MCYTLQIFAEFLHVLELKKKDFNTDMPVRMCSCLVRMNIVVLIDYANKFNNS